jgi:DNA-binding transcriptional regulator YiaG
MTPLQFTRRRKKLFKSQAKAAEALGVTQQAISQWETGRKKVPLFAIKLLQCLWLVGPYMEMK